MRSLSIKMPDLSDLTPREIDTLQQVLAGRTNKAIAAEFCIAEKPVEFHLHKMYVKIGVRTRLMVDVWALEQEIESKPAWEIV